MISAENTDPIVLKIATLAPEGSVWWKELQMMNEEVQSKSDGRLKFVIYPGGTMGDDGTVLYKLYSGQLDGASFTGNGLMRIYKDFAALTLPQMFQTHAEVDYVLSQMDQELKSAFKKQGYEVLGFTGIGFTYVFSKNPITSAQEFQKSKAWLYENDPIMKALFKAAKVTPIPLGVGDVMTALQTGLVDTVFNTPTGILAMQWFTKVNTMTDIPLTHAFGAFLISNKSWEKLPEDLQSLILAQVQKHLDKITDQNRKEDKRALEIISERGVTIVEPTEKLQSDFQDISAKAIKSLTNATVSQKMVTRIESLVNEYRQKTPSNL
ncbi:TRAP transporter substrate-binding protein DctP [bacterium]|nr:TRAP transporter substrate-binding protein DctP [candidate division CSSED10-310 bacterium]